MGYFNYKRPALGSYFDARNPPYLQRRGSALGSVKTMAHNQYGGKGSKYDIERFNQVNDNLEDGSVVESMIPTDPVLIHMMLRKIYLRDAISGSVVDIYSSLPWGKLYELIGVDDPKVLQMFHDMVEALGVWSELPMISREFQIIGRSMSSLAFNERLGHWDAMVPIDPDNARLTPMPYSGTKPLIDVLASPAWRKFAASTDPRVVSIKETMNPEFLQMLQNSSGYIPLDPLNTLFLARRVNQYDHIGTSLFSRILPAWAYETALWNASLTGVRRRNRSILLLTAGLEDSWEPEEEEIQSLVSLFMQADEDPTGAVVGIRNGVEVSEVRDPTAIWGISQEYEFLSMVKMRALGVSEAYLSGETNVSNMESARTSLGKNISAFRDYMLREIFQRQLFPTFARIHNIRKRTQAELAHKIRIGPGPHLSVKAALDIPLDQLVMPTLITEDTMRPEQDIAYIELLTMLQEKGLPVPLRIWASSAGYDLDKAMAMMQEDTVLRKRLEQLGAQAPGGGGGGDMGSDMGGGEEAFPPAEPTEEPGAGEGGPGGGGATLPPKWSVASNVHRLATAKLAKQSSAAFEKMKVSPLMRALARIEPKILAEMQIPDSRILVPYDEG